METIGVPKQKWADLDDWLKENPAMASALSVIGGPAKGCAWMRLETIDEPLATFLKIRFGRDGWS